MHKPFWVGDKRFWSSIAISSGLVIVFFGISFTEAGLTIRWINIGFGIALLIIGFSASPLGEAKKGKPQSLNPAAHPVEGAGSSEYEFYVDYRKSLQTSLQEQARSFDRHILALAGGTFGLSIFIIKALAPSPVADSMPYLMGAWISFAISITLTLASFLLSQKASMCYIQKIDDNLRSKTFNANGMRTNIYTKLVYRFNCASMGAFIAGVGFLICFGRMNLTLVNGG